MTVNLAFGTLLISLTVLVQTLGLVLLTRIVSWFVQWLRLHRHDFGRSIAIMSVMLGLFAIHTVEIWLWAAAYVGIGMTGDFSDALYFSTVTFSTLGYGDIVPDPAWRLFASLEGVNGLILIGWSIAYLVAASTRHGPFRIGEHF